MTIGKLDNMWPSCTPALIGVTFLFFFFLFFTVSHNSNSNTRVEEYFAAREMGRLGPRSSLTKWVSVFHYFLPEFSPAFFIRHFCESSAYRSACRSLSNSRCLFPSGPNLLINKYSWITQSQAHYLEAISIQFNSICLETHKQELLTLKAQLAGSPKI